MKNDFLKDVAFLITILICSVFSLIFVKDHFLYKHVPTFSPNSVKQSVKAARFSKVDANYYRGGQPSDEDIKYLSMIGVKTIINLRLPDYARDSRQRKLAKMLGMKYTTIRINPFIPPTEEQADYFLKITNDPKNTPVYVHCWHGEDRTGLMTGLYRVKKHGWSADKAYHEMLANGFHQRLFFMQKRFLYKYSNKLRK